MIYGKMALIYDPLMRMLGIERGLDSFVSQTKLNLPPRPVILDAGCGTGILTFAIFKYYPNATVYAFDIDNNMLKVLKKERDKRGIPPSRLVLRQGDLKMVDKLYQKNFFDCIFISGALEYAPLKQTITKMSKLLKRGGVFVNVGVKVGPLGQVLKRVFSFDFQKPEDIASILKENHFFNIKIKPLSIKNFPANLSRISTIANKR